MTDDKVYNKTCRMGQDNVYITIHYFDKNNWKCLVLRTKEKKQKLTAIGKNKRDIVIYRSDGNNVILHSNSL